MTSSKLTAQVTGLRGQLDDRLFAGTMILRR